MPRRRPLFVTRLCVVRLLLLRLTRPFEIVFVRAKLFLLVPALELALNVKPTDGTDEHERDDSSDGPRVGWVRHARACFDDGCDFDFCIF